MEQGTIVSLHIARVKGTPSDPVNEATAISAAGLEGDRSCNPENTRQVLIMDKETLDKFGLEPGQIKEKNPASSDQRRVGMVSQNLPDIVNGMMAAAGM